MGVVEDGLIYEGRDLEKGWGRVRTLVVGRRRLSWPWMYHPHRELLADPKHICLGKTFSGLFRWLQLVNLPRCLGLKMEWV
jgi:hypothetical protein